MARFWLIHHTQMFLATRYSTSHAKTKLQWWYVVQHISAIKIQKGMYHMLPKWCTKKNYEKIQMLIETNIILTGWYNGGAAIASGQKRFFLFSSHFVCFGLIELKTFDTLCIYYVYICMFMYNNCKICKMEREGNGSVNYIGILLCLLALVQLDTLCAHSENRQMEW